MNMLEKRPDDEVIEFEASSEALFCLTCGLSIDEYKTLCPNCGSPTNGVSNLDPMQVIYSDGAMLRKLATAKLERHMLIGVWALFVPILALALIISASIVLNEAGGGTTSFLLFWMCIGLSVMAFMFIYRTTQNYLRQNTTVEPEGDDYVDEWDWDAEFEEGDDN